jgi:hypothetical protein
VFGFLNSLIAFHILCILLEIYSLVLFKFLNKLFVFF